MYIVVQDMFLLKWKMINKCACFFFLHCFITVPCEYSGNNSEKQQNDENIIFNSNDERIIFENKEIELVSKELKIEHFPQGKKLKPNQSMFNKILGQDTLYHADHRRIKMWSNLFKTFFKGKITVNLIISDDNWHDPDVEDILKGLETEDPVVVRPTSLKNKNWHLGRSVGLSDKKYVIVFARTAVDAWANLSTMWKQIGNENGQDFVLLIMSSATEDEAEMIAKNTWIELHFFYFPVARLEFDTNTMKYNLMVTVYNPYQMPAFNNGNPYVTFILNENSIYIEYKKVYRHLKERAQNLKGFPIRITMHAFGIISHPIMDGKGNILYFSGKEGEVVKQYARVMNFTPVYQFPRDNVTYGGILKDGTLTGGMKDLEEGFTDIQGNFRMIEFGNTFNKSNFLKNAQNTKVLIITPIPDSKVASIRSMLHSLNEIARYASLLFLLVITLAWTAARLKNSKKYSNTSFMIYDTVTKTFLDSLGAINAMSIKGPVGSVERFAFFSISVWALVVNGVYVGKNATKLTVKVGAELNTLTQLAESGLPIAYLEDAGTSLVTGGIGQPRHLQDIRQLLTKRQFIFVDPYATISIMTVYKNISVMVPDYAAETCISQFYYEDGEDAINVLKEVVDNKFSSQATTKWSPLLEGIDNVLEMLQNTGLTAYWDAQTKFKYSLMRLHRPRLNTSDSSDHNVKLNLIHLRFALIMWGSLLSFSTVVFILEIALYYYLKKYF